MIYTVVLFGLAVWRALVDAKKIDSLQDQLDEARSAAVRSDLVKADLTKQLKALRDDLHSAGLDEQNLAASVKSLQTDLIETQNQVNDLKDRILLAKANASARARAAAIARWSNRPQVQDALMPRLVPDCEGQTIIPEVAAAEQACAGESTKTAVPGGSDAQL